MSLSLEVKKFVNSESIGAFVTVMLPGEVPAANEEIRAMNRERAAAQRASREALSCEEIEKRAKADADEAAKELEEAKKSLAEQDKALEQQKKDHDKLKSEHNKKKDARDKAKKALDEITEKRGKLAEAIKTAAEAFSAAEKAKSEAEEKLAEIEKAKKAAPDEAKKDGASADEKTELPKKAEGEEGTGAEERADEASAEAEKNTESEKNEASENAEKPEEKAETESEKTDETDTTDAEGEKTESEEKTEDDEKPEKSDESEKPEAEAEKKESGEKPDPAYAEAEAERERAKAALEKAKAELEAAQKAEKSAEETEEKRREDYEKLEAEFNRFSSLFDSADEELERARSERSGMSDHVKALEKAGGEARSAHSEAQKASAAAAKEAERLKAAVRTLKTEHESAEMHYLESGKGETLILVHSAGQSLFTFRSIFNKLAMNYRVIAVDLMGHGYSERPEYFDYSTASHAESLAAFMDALGIERAHILGFSLGAGYALELARRYPERIMSVVALSPGGVTGRMPLSVRMMESAVFGGIASRFFRVKTVEKLLDECLFDHTVIGPHEVSEYYKCVCGGESRRAIRLSLSSFGEKALIASLGEIRTDVLVVSSEMDRWRTMEQGEEYARALAHGEFTVMRNAGHLMHEEKPDRTVELVRSFIPAGYGDDAY